MFMCMFGCDVETLHTSCLHWDHFTINSRLFCNYCK